jgi:hypothetical protein
MTWGSETGQNLQLQCECLPSCTEQKYDMELSSTQIDRDEVATYATDLDFVRYFFLSIVQKLFYIIA